MIEYDTPLPEYCTKCGRPMVQTSYKAAPDFDRLTGEPNGRVERKFRCEREECWWQRIWSFDLHDHFLVIDSPKDNILDEPHRSILRIVRVG